MVARVNFSNSIPKILYYHEQKQRLGKAEFMDAFNFIKDSGRLSYSDKVNYFSKIIQLNQRTKMNALHISLSFHPSDRLSRDLILEIAQRYMQKVGYGEQPYLVYRHYDTVHPHLHIVSTSIGEHGDRVDFPYDATCYPFKISNEIEQDYGLRHPELIKTSLAAAASPIQALKIRRGQSEIKRELSKILLFVVSEYRFTSLDELNSILKLYNAMADPGQEGSRVRFFQGLNYRVLDEKGNCVGIPIKASSFYFKPTLKYLRAKFNENEPLHETYRQSLKTSIDWIMARGQTSLHELTRDLEKEKINLVPTRNQAGLLTGVSYVDHRNKTVFEGSTLGGAYSAEAIRQRYNLNPNMFAECPDENLRIKKGMLSPADEPAEFLSRTQRETQMKYL